MLIEPVLVHDPVGLLAVRSTAFIEDEGLAHTDPLAAGVYDLVTTGGLPESSSRSTVRSRACWILLVLVAEEIPVILWRRSNPALLCGVQP